MREAGIQEFFTEGDIIPLTLVYEDLILQYEETVRKILDYLELHHVSIKISPPCFSPAADDISEEWVQCFRQELQVNWVNVGW